MISSQKLSRIRKELRRALEATGDDPIRWLEERMSAAERKGARAEGDEILQSLQRVLASPEKRKPPAKRRRKQRLGTKT